MSARAADCNHLFLELSVARCSREHLDVSDVAHACQVHEYTVKAEAKDGLYYSPEYYTAAVAVRTDSSGELAATVVLTKADSDYKPAKCRFELTEKPTDESEANAVTQPAGTAQTPKNPPTSRPQTGDDSMLDIYLLICIVAAGGLFMLAVIYSVSTERLIKRK